jgi:hypothetical protein
MRLKCLSNYSNEARGHIYTVGQEFDVSDADAAFLLADSPGSFAEVKMVERPPANKMVSEPKAKK